MAIRSIVVIACRRCGVAATIAAVVGLGYCCWPWSVERSAEPSLPPTPLDGRTDRGPSVVVPAQFAATMLQPGMPNRGKSLPMVRLPAPDPMSRKLIRLPPPHDDSRDQDLESTGSLPPLVRLPAVDEPFLSTIQSSEVAPVDIVDLPAVDPPVAELRRGATNEDSRFDHRQVEPIADDTSNLNAPGSGLELNSATAASPKQVTEQVTEPVKEQVAEQVTQPVMEQVKEQVTQPVKEQVTEQAAEPVTEQVAERAPRPSGPVSSPPLLIESPASQDVASQEMADHPEPVGASRLPRCETHYDWTNPNSSLFAAHQQAERLLQRGRALASRGATHSARGELEAALVVLAQALDSYDGTATHSRSLRLAFLALEEAGDFVRHSPREQLSLDVPLIVKRHRSQVLSEADADGMAAGAAAQRYAAFAQAHLQQALGGSRLGAHSLYGLGKLHAHFAGLDSSTERVHHPHAIVLQQTALAIDGSQIPAAHELSVLLVRAGRLADAREVLRGTVSRSPSPQAWHMLAEVHERLGEREFARLARAEVQISSARSSLDVARMGSPDNGNKVRWVDQATFERESGGEWGPSP